jgi:predicted deacylase
MSERREETPRTNAKELRRYPDNRPDGTVPTFVARRLERSRRANIRRAWRLRDEAMAATAALEMMRESCFELADKCLDLMLTAEAAAPAAPGSGEGEAPSGAAANAAVTSGSSESR